MRVERSQLIQYDIASDLYFSSRSTGQTSRDQFFINNPTRLSGGLYCAIGNDMDGWELETYNGVNWVTIAPDSSYSLIITSTGLSALSNVLRGGLQLYFAGIKILDSLVKNPETPIANWIDVDFTKAGNVVFTCGTNGSPNQYESDGSPCLNRILKWRFNNSTGGLQYILTLPPEGIGAVADNGSEDYKVGTIGLYIKDPNDGTTDVLFAVACLPALVAKYGTNVKREGNTTKFYFNTVLNNLGLVSNMEVLQEDNHNIPEVPNESLLLYQTSALQKTYNCYVVDSLYGTNVPALAVPRATDPTAVSNTEWAFFQPADNFLILTADKFESNVNNYTFVYWNGTTSKYALAEGKYPGETGDNEKLAIGIRVGNTIVYSGEIINNSTAYQYSVAIASGGINYDIGDELLLIGVTGLTFKLQVTNKSSTGVITGFKFLGPNVGNIAIPGTRKTLSASYDPRSKLPRYGSGARFTVTATVQPSSAWNFPASWLNKPVYCDKGANAGKPTLSKTDSFLGWCTGTNSLRIALDLRNEASYVTSGTTRYATNAEVKDTYSYPDAAEQTAVTPKELRNNYLQTTVPASTTQPGATLANPIEVNTYVHHNQILLGRGATAPYGNNPGVTDNSLSFYGCAYRAEWADLAEFYEADADYEPGTLITIGKGDKEISIATSEPNGVISTKPGYQLGIRKSDRYVPVALTGRVPVKFDGMCMPKFGDKIYLSKLKKGCASTIENGTCLGKIIEKDFGTKTLIECVVRLEF